MGNAGHKMLGKELKLRGNRKKRLKVVRKIVSHLFVYCNAILALLGALLWLQRCDFGTAGTPLFIDYSGAKCAYFALKIAAAQESLFRVIENSGFAD